MDKRSEKILFREVQRFRQIWIWLIILCLAVILWYGTIKQILLNQPFGSNPAPDVVLVIFWVIFGVCFPVLFYSLRMITEVRADGLYIHFFTVKKILWQELKSYKVQSYRPIREYGGWGVRYGSKGKAYTVSGNQGVQLELITGKRLLVGSQKPEELARAISKALGKDED